MPRLAQGLHLLFPGCTKDFQTCLNLLKQRGLVICSCLRSLKARRAFKSLSRLHSLKARRTFKSLSRLVAVGKNFNTCASDRRVAVRTQKLKLAPMFREFCTGCMRFGFSIFNLTPLTLKNKQHANLITGKLR